MPASNWEEAKQHSYRTLPNTCQVILNIRCFLLTFWYFKWLELHRLNVVYQVRHLFRGHSLTSSSTLGKRRKNAAVWVCPSEATNAKAQCSISCGVFHCPWLAKAMLHTGNVTQERTKWAVRCKCLHYTDALFILFMWLPGKGLHYLYPCTVLSTFISSVGQIINTALHFWCQVFLPTMLSTPQAAV